MGECRGECCMNSGRALTAFDFALLAIVVIAAVLWATALSPGLIGLTALLAVVLLPMLVVTAWMLMHISDRLSGKYKAMIRTVLRTRKDFLSAKRRENGVHRTRGTLHNLRSAFLFFITFLLYFLVMIVFFYGLGGQPLSDPNRLMIAAFLGTSALHFSGYVQPDSAPKIVLDFLVPFGIIVGLIDLTVIGPDALLSLGFKHAPAVLLFFADYYGLDLIMQRRRGQLRFSQPNAPEKKSGGSER